MQDKLADEQITSADYQDIRIRYETRRDEIVTKIRDLKHTKTDFEQYLRYGLSLLCNIDQFYTKAELDVKQGLIGSIFPNNLIFDGEKVRTPKEDEFVALIKLLNSTLNTNKKGQLMSKSKLSYQVNLQGFEPRISTSVVWCSIQLSYRSSFSLQLSINI